MIIVILKILILKEQHLNEYQVMMEYEQLIDFQLVLYELKHISHNIFEIQKNS